MQELNLMDIDHVAVGVPAVGMAAPIRLGVRPPYLVSRSGTQPSQPWRWFDYPGDGKA